MRQPPTNLRRSALPRVLLLAAALLAGVLGVPAAAQAQIIDPLPERQRFQADSGDRCRYGETLGVLAWRVTRPPALAPVDVQGVLVDRPAVDDSRTCLDDGYYSVVTFAGYAGERLLDRMAYRTDNGRLEFKLTLGETSILPAGIDRVVVQVCRYPLGPTPMPVYYCGAERTYRPNVIGPA
ncbi:hypothetical protein O7627_23005 [Solwaraspora sp. WMMD1047]|uniref:hypothetical protein n=1 Tax=Solwaraspora sp. WMMD1047 TaxID=3016102 RepID=UPI00241809BC|nr:hypothetical protein [Solwaraspora sp. WMMD1047]MDG4832156.1 hypothetical protein [Solwaraspora sp. WMMD1047]